MVERRSKKERHLIVFCSEELKKLLTLREKLQLQPLFSKFESLSEKDRLSIAEDEELLQLLSALKDKLDKQNPDA